MRSRADLNSVHKAVMRGSLLEVDRAIVQGNDVDELDREGRTPLFYAASDGNLAIAAELVRNLANVSARDKSLRTSLHFAASAYMTKIAELLLKNGADVDAQDVHGNTSLSDAVFESRGRGQMIMLLLSFGASKALKNKHGVSPEELAKSIANYEVTPFLAG